MRVGVPKEIKTDEYRVGLTPATVAELKARGHQIFVEAGAGEGAGLTDQAYARAGAQISPDAEEVSALADLIVKVKEPLAPERAKLRTGQIIFTYLHLAADRSQADELLASGVTAIAYETVTDATGGLPLLAPMSKVAGRMAAQVAAHFLERPNGGRGILLGGIREAPPAKVIVLGGGIVGRNAATVALAMGADVTVVTRSAATREVLKRHFGMKLHTEESIPARIAALCKNADVIIGAVLVAGGAAPKLVSADTVKAMRAGAVIVDVAIDQGGCIETSRPTTHSDPVYVIDGVVHYCVANMPGAVPRTSTFALDAATRPFVLCLADNGLAAALLESADLRAGVNVHAGRLTCEAVAGALGLPFTALDKALRS
jgi:alanine dehydrogenase